MPDGLRLEADAWLRRAHDDLGAARKLLSGSDPFPATAAYHCQQAAEKALKALIASTGKPVPKMHDLRALIAQCTQIETRLAALHEACEELTPYATEFRYPTDSRDPELAEVACAIVMAAEIVTAIATTIDERLPGSH